jgi:hypothetical protein
MKRKKNKNKTMLLDECCLFPGDLMLTGERE